ncbi:hypothetical protein RhiirC2_800586, partial [Rhizophagus irregularis]
VTPLCIIPKLSPLRSLLLLTSQERIRHDTSIITSPFTCADLDVIVRSYYGRLDIQPDFSQIDVVTLFSPSLLIPLDEAASLAFAASLLATHPDNYYCFYTDGSLINLGTPDISMDFVIDWDLTWFSLNSEPQHDASFTRAYASSHHIFKFKLFLKDLPTLEHLKRIRPDLYINILSCRSCLDSKEDFMHLFMCKCRRIAMEQILLSYQNHFINKLQEAGDLIYKDPSLIINKFKSLPCWSFSSSNWASYSIVRGCLPKSFVKFFEELSIPRISAMKVISAIHNHFIQKIRKQIWLPRSYDKSKWKDAMNITQKLKLSQPSNLPKSTTR